MIETTISSVWFLHSDSTAWLTLLNYHPYNCHYFTFPSIILSSILSLPFHQYLCIQFGAGSLRLIKCLVILKHCYIWILGNIKLHKIKLVFPWQLFTYGITTIRKTLSQVEAEGQVLPDGTLVVYVSIIPYMSKINYAWFSLGIWEINLAVCSLEFYVLKWKMQRWQESCCGVL